MASAREPGTDTPAKAAHALNKAALIASDCGDEALARHLCHQHIAAYRSLSRPLTARQARQLLGPALNLPRLALRAGRPDEALCLLDGIYRALITGTDTTIDGCPLPLAALTGTKKELRQLREDTWLQHLAEGIRAHAQASRWPDAAKFAESRHGIGAHLMEGRQAVIIASVLAGDLNMARQVLAESAVTQPWERHIAACLQVMCATPDESAAAVHAMTDRFLADTPIPGYIVFRTRLGTAAATLAATTSRTPAARIITETADEIIAAPDGYAARDLLACPLPAALLPAAHREKLTAITTAASLGTRTIPAPLRRDLIAAASTAAALIEPGSPQPDLPQARSSPCSRAPGDTSPSTAPAC